MSDKPALQDEIIVALCDLTLWLEAAETPYVTIGGVGVSLLAGSRTTQDIDAVLWLDTGTLESFIPAGAAFGFIPRISDAADFARRNRVILLEHQPTGIGVDLSCGALPFEKEMVARGLGNYQSHCPPPQRHR